MVGAIVGPNEPAQEQKPSLDCRPRGGVRSEVGEASGEWLGRAAADGLHVAAEASDDFALPAGRDEGGFERAVRPVQTAEREGQSVEVIGRRHAVAKIAEPIAELAASHGANELGRRAIHRVEEVAGRLPNLGHCSIAEGAYEMRRDLPLRLRQATHFCDGIARGERGPVGGEERIAELRKCSLPSEFGASATGSQ